MQSKGLSRNTVDKYYTKSSVVLECLNLLKNRINRTDLIIEPSAGNGSFINGIKELSNNYIFYDLEPEHNEIIKQDYLALESISLTHCSNKSSNKKIYVIGNPPFGRQSSLAIKFIKKSCEFCDFLCFILPRSFKKQSLQNKFPLHFHLVEEIDLPSNSFLVNGVEYDVPCIFQIWEKRDNQRKNPDKLKPIGFVFVKKNENPDISVRRVGVNAGTILIDTSKSSHYFIKFFKNNVDLNKLKDIEYDTSTNTVGPKSISKQDLILKFNEVIQ